MTSIRRSAHIATKWAVLLIALTTAITGLLQAINLAPAFADTGDYTWPLAPCASSGSNLGHTSGTGYWCSSYNWGVSSCPTGDTHCGTTMNGYYLYDQWDEVFRNCVSYTAFKLSQVFGINPNNWGNGADWNNSALTAGYSDDSSPQVGDIAQWDSPAPWGHTAYVFAVNNGVASYAEYNHAQDGTFQGSLTSASGSQGAPTHWIHAHTGNLPFEAAFQGNGNNDLYIYNSRTGSATNTTQGMASGTSPAIVDTTDGYAVAFQANNGNLYTYDVTTGTTTNTGQGMASGTSPSIAASPTGGYEVAFQANNNYLYIYDNSLGTVATTLGLASGTSPAITYVSSGYEEAFQANGGNLYVNGSNSSGSTGQGMASGTSPSISAFADGSSNFEGVFQAAGTSQYLYVYSSATGSAANTSQGMASGTSPSVSAQ